MPLIAGFGMLIHTKSRRTLIIIPRTGNFCAGNMIIGIQKMAQFKTSVESQS